MQQLVFTNWNVELTEERDFPGDPAPYLNLRLTAAQSGGGRCGCGRQLPGLNLNGGLEEHEAVALAVAILQWSRDLHARRADRARMADKVRARRERAERRADAEREAESLAALEARLLSD